MCVASLKHRCMFEVVKPEWINRIPLVFTTPTPIGQILVCETSLTDTKLGKLGNVLKIARLARPIA